MTYLKIYTEFAKDLEPFNDTEVGRLFRAMLLYAETGKEADLRGNERFLWCSAKRNIDNQENAYKKRCEVNKKNITNRYESYRMDTKNYESYQEKEKEKDKEKIKKEVSPKGDTKKETFSQSSKAAPASLEQIRQAFIECCPSLAKPNTVSTWTATRKQAVKSKNLQLNEACEMFKRVEASDFLSGRSEKWGGCSFDWIFKPANWQKISEGTYDNKGSQKGHLENSSIDWDELEAMYK